MKTIYKALLFIPISFLFVACGGNEKIPVQKKIAKEYHITVPIRGLRGQSVSEKELPSVYLADIIGEDAARNIVRADMQYADSYLEINGLKDLETPTTLKDFTIQIEGKTGVNFGNCTSNVVLATDFESDTKQSIQKVLDFIQDVLNTYTHNNKSARLIVSFSSTETILEKDNVYLKIVIRADYIYNSY
jgi:hypothetical protein